MRVSVPSRQTKWKIQRMTTWSPFTSTGRAQVELIDFARASTARSFATCLSRPMRGAPSGWAAAERLLARRRGERLPFSALFCANDQMAMGAMSCLQHRGISVPGQCSVVGYDDSDVAAWLSPRLTTVQIPIAEMGLNACRLLLNACTGSTLPVSRKFAPRLVMRDSLANAAPSGSGPRA